MPSPYREPPPAIVVRRRPWWWGLAVVLYPFIGGRPWVRRLFGGKWELHWIDPCKAFLWLQVEEFGEFVPCSTGCYAEEEHPLRWQRTPYSFDGRSHTPPHEKL